MVSSNPAYAERQDLNFPDVNACEDGLRYQVFFPQCWDGVNLDSADHKSHMAYPIDNFNGGSCPSSHPVHVVGLFYEMVISTAGNPHWGPDAYVLSSGDPSGLAFHGDFQNGQAILSCAYVSTYDRIHPQVGTSRCSRTPSTTATT